MPALTAIVVTLGNVHTIVALWINIQVMVMFDLISTIWSLTFGIIIPWFLFNSLARPCWCQLRANTVRVNNTLNTIVQFGWKDFTVTKLKEIHSVYIISPARTAIALWWLNSSRRSSKGNVNASQQIKSHWTDGLKNTNKREPECDFLLWIIWSTLIRHPIRVVVVAVSFLFLSRD